MTSQEIFDTVVAHLRKQGMKAQEGDNCKYRTHDGLKCAVGCLIPDEEYSPQLEEYGPAVLAKVRIIEGDPDLLITLQRVHDGTTVDAWEAQFNRVAKDFGLVYRRAPV